MTLADVRTSEQGNQFNACVIREFIRHALVHDAANDAVTALLFDHVARGRLHPEVVRNSLRPIIDEILETATPEDWMAITADLIGEAKEALASDALASGPS